MFFPKGRVTVQQTTTFSTSITPKKNPKKWRKRFFFAFFLFFSLCLIGLIGGYYWVKNYILQEEQVKLLIYDKLRKIIHGEVFLEDVHWISGPFFYKGIRFHNANVKNDLDMSDYPLFSIQEVTILFEIQWFQLTTDPIRLTHISLKKPTLAINYTQANWNLFDLYPLSADSSSKEFSLQDIPSLPEIEMEEVMILYQDKTIFKTPIQATIEKAILKPDYWELGIHIRDRQSQENIHLLFQGRLDKKEQKGLLTIKTTAPVEIQSRLFQLFSDEVPFQHLFEQIRPYQPDGKIQLEAQLEFRENPTEIRYGFNLGLEQFSFQIHPLNFPLKEFRGKLVKSLSSEVISLQECFGKLNETVFEITGELEQPDPNAPFWGKVSLKDFPLEKVLLENLPESLALKNILKEIQFQGKVSAFCHFSGDALSGIQINSAYLDLEQGKFEHTLIHFPFENIQTRIHIQKEKIWIEEANPLRFEALKGKIQIWGECENLTQVPEFKAYAKISHAHAEESLYQTLPPKAKEVWDTIVPSGKADGQAWIKGKLTGKIEDLDWRGEVIAEDLEFFPRVFPVRVYGVSGRVLVTKDTIHLLDGKGYLRPDKKGEPDVRLLLGTITPLSSGAVTLKLQGKNVPITKEIYYAVRHADTPVDTGKILDRYLPWGTVNVDVDIFAPEGEDTDFDVSIFIESLETQMNVQPFPDSNSGRVPFHQIKGFVEILPDGVHIKNMRGSLYHGGYVTVNGIFSEKEDTLHLDIIGKKVDLHPTLKNALEPEGQKAWDTLEPRGTVNLEVILDQEAGGEPKIRLKIQPESCEVTYEELPYTLRLLNQGTVEIDEQKIVVQNLIGKHDESSLAVEGVLTRHGDQPLGIDLKLSSQKLIVNQELKRALPASMQEIFKTLEADGEIQLDCHLQQKSTQKDVDYVLKIEAVKVSILYQKFPYLLHNVKGSILFESRKHRLELIKLEGERNQSTVQIQGVVEFAEEDVQFTLGIRARDFLVNSEVKEALHSKHHSVWEMFRPHGRIHLNTQLSKQFGGPIQNQTKITVKSGSITYEEFRLPIENLEGQIEVKNERFVIKKLNGNTKNALIALSGSLEDNLHSSLLELHSEFSNLPLDEELGQALPKEFQQMWRELNPRGLTRGKGTLKIMTNAPGKTLITYAGSVFLKESQITAGLKFRDMNGQIDFDGKIYDRKHILRGKLSLDSLSVTDVFPQDLKMTEVSTEILLQSNYFLLREIHANLYDGKLVGEVLLHNSAIQPFMIDFQIKGTNLEKLAIDLMEKDADFEKNPIAGRLDAGIEIQGNSGKMESLVGAGWIEVAQAKLWRLPLFLSIFDVFNLASGSSFESGNIEFKVKEKNIHIEKMHFASIPLTLKGYGIMDFDLDLDFYFNTVIAPSLFPKIPILTDTWHELKGNFILLRVYGPYNQLETTVSSFRAVTEAFGVEQKPSLSEIKKQKQKQK